MIVSALAGTGISLLLPALAGVGRGRPKKRERQEIGRD